MSSLTPFSVDDVVEAVDLFTSFDLLGRMRRWCEAAAFQQLTDDVAHSFLPEVPPGAAGGGDAAPSTSKKATGAGGYTTGASAAAGGGVTTHDVHEQVVHIIRALIEHDIRLILGPRHLGEMVQHDPEIQSVAEAAIALQEQQTQQYHSIQQEVIREEQRRQQQLMREREAAAGRQGFVLHNFDKLVSKLNKGGKMTADSDDDGDDDMGTTDPRKRRKRKRRLRKQARAAAASDAVLSAARQAACVSPLSALGGVILKYCDRYPEALRGWIRNFQCSMVAARLDTRMLAERIVESLAGDVLEVLYPTPEALATSEYHGGSSNYYKQQEAAGNEEDEEEGSGEKPQQQQQQSRRRKCEQERLAVFEDDIFASVLYDDSIYTSPDSDESTDSDASSNDGDDNNKDAGAGDRRTLSRNNLTVSGALRHVRRLLRDHNEAHRLRAPSAEAAASGDVSLGGSNALGAAALNVSSCSRAAALAAYRSNRSPSPAALASAGGDVLDMVRQQDAEHHHHHHRNSPSPAAPRGRGHADDSPSTAANVFAPPASLVDILSPLPPALLRQRTAAASTSPSPSPKRHHHHNSPPPRQQQQPQQDVEQERQARRPVTRRQLERILHLVPVLMSIVDVRCTGSVTLDALSDFCSSLIFALESAASKQTNDLHPWNLSGSGVSTGTTLSHFALRYQRLFRCSGGNDKVLSFYAIPENSAQASSPSMMMSTSAAAASAAAATANALSGGGGGDSGGGAANFAAVPHRVVAPLPDNRQHREFEDSVLEKKLRVLLSPLAKQRAQKKQQEYTAKLVNSNGQYPVTATVVAESKRNSSSSRTLLVSSPSARNKDAVGGGKDHDPPPARSSASKKELEELSSGAVSNNKVIGEPILPPKEAFSALDLVLLQDIAVVAMSNSIGQVACFTADARATRLATSPRAVSAVTLLVTCSGLYRGAAGGDQRQIIVAADRSGRVSFWEMHRGGSMPSMCSLDLCHSEQLGFPTRFALVHEKNWTLMLLLSDYSVVIMDLRRLPISGREDKTTASKKPDFTAVIGSFPSRFPPTCAALCVELNGLLLCGASGGPEFVPLGCVAGHMKQSPVPLVSSAPPPRGSNAASAAAGSSTATSVKNLKHGGASGGSSKRTALAVAAVAAASASGGEGGGASSGGSGGGGGGILACACDPDQPQGLTCDSSLLLVTWDLRNMAPLQSFSLAVAGDMFFRPKQLVIGLAKNQRHCALLTDGNTAFWFERSNSANDSHTHMDAFPGDGDDDDNSLDGDIGSDTMDDEPSLIVHDRSSGNKKRKGGGGTTAAAVGSRSNTRGSLLVDDGPGEPDESAFEAPVVAVFDFADTAAAAQPVLLVVTERSVLVWRYDPAKAEAVRTDREAKRQSEADEYERREQQRQWRESLSAFSPAASHRREESSRPSTPAAAAAAAAAASSPASPPTPLPTPSTPVNQQQQQQDTVVLLGEEADRDLDNLCRRFESVSALKQPWEIFSRGALPRSCAAVTAAELNRVHGAALAASCRNNELVAPHLLLGLADGALVVAQPLTGAVLHRIDNIFARPLTPPHDSWNSLVPPLVLVDADDEDAKKQNSFLSSSQRQAAAEQRQQQNEERELHGQKNQHQQQHKVDYNTNFAIGSLCLLGDFDLVATEKATGHAIIIRDYLVASSGKQQQQGAAAGGGSWNVRRFATHIVRIFGHAAPTCCAFSLGLSDSALSIFSAAESYFWPLKCWPKIQSNAGHDGTAAAAAAKFSKEDSVLVQVLANPFLERFFTEREKRIEAMNNKHGPLWHERISSATGSKKKKMAVGDGGSSNNSNDDDNDHDDDDAARPRYALNVAEDFLNYNSVSDILAGPEPPRRALLVLARRILLVELPVTSKRTRVASRVTDSEMILASWSTALRWRHNAAPPTNVAAVLAIVPLVVQDKGERALLFVARSDGTLSVYDVTDLLSGSSTTATPPPSQGARRQKRSSSVVVSSLVQMRPGSAAAHNVSSSSSGQQTKVNNKKKQDDDEAADIDDVDEEVPATVTLLARRRIARRKVSSLVYCGASRVIVAIDDAKTLHEVSVDDLLEPPPPHMLAATIGNVTSAAAKPLAVELCVAHTRTAAFKRERAAARNAQRKRRTKELEAEQQQQQRAREREEEAARAAMSSMEDGEEAPVHEPFASWAPGAASSSSRSSSSSLNSRHSQGATDDDDDGDGFFDAPVPCNDDALASTQTPSAAAEAVRNNSLPDVASPQPRPSVADLPPSSTSLSVPRAMAFSSASPQQQQQQQQSLNRLPRVRGPSFAPARDSGRSSIDDDIAGTRIHKPRGATRRFPVGRAATPQVLKTSHHAANNAAMDFLREHAAAQQQQQQQQPGSPVAQHRRRPSTPNEIPPTNVVDVDKRFVAPSGPVPVKKSVVSDTLIGLYKKKPLV